MKKFLGLAFAPILLFPSTALCANWVQAATSEDSFVTIFVDTNSIVKRKNIVAFWELNKYLVPRQDGTSYVIAYELADCPSKLSTINKIITYDSDGKKIYSLDSDNMKISPAVPNSIGEGVINTVCSANFTAIPSRARPEQAKPQVNMGTLNNQLKQAVSTQNWKETLNIIDQMVAITPLNDRQQRNILINYRERIQSLYNSEANSEAESSKPPVSSANRIAVTNLRLIPNSIGVDVRGIITNTSDEPIEISMLDYELVDSSGVPIDNGTFVVAKTINPGQTIAISDFKTQSNLQGHQVSSLSVRALKTW